MRGPYAHTSNGEECTMCTVPEIKEARGLSLKELRDTREQYRSDRIIAIWKDQSGKIHVRVAARC